MCSVEGDEFNSQWDNNSSLFGLSQMKYTVWSCSERQWEAPVQHTEAATANQQSGWQKNKNLSGCHFNWHISFLCTGRHVFPVVHLSQSIYCDVSVWAD